MRVDDSSPDGELTLTGVVLMRLREGRNRDAQPNEARSC
jgi:hypothetical protein